MALRKTASTEVWLERVFRFVSHNIVALLIALVFNLIVFVTDNLLVVTLQVVTVGLVAYVAIARFPLFNGWRFGKRWLARTSAFAVLGCMLFGLEHWALVQYHYKHDGHFHVEQVTFDDLVVGRYPNFVVRWENIGDAELAYSSRWHTVYADPIPPHEQLEQWENDNYASFLDNVKYSNTFANPENGKVPGHSHWTKGIPGPPLTQEMIDRLKSGKAGLLTLGKVDFYNSIRPAPEFCALWGLNQASIHPCREHNTE